MALEELADGKSTFSTILNYLGFGALATLGTALLSRVTKGNDGKDIFDFLPAPIKKIFDGISTFINGWIDKAGSWLANALGLKPSTPEPAGATPPPAATPENTAQPAPAPTPAPAPAPAPTRNGAARGR